MRVIGGLIAWKRSVPVTDASVRAMVGTLPTTTTAVIVTDTGSAGFFTSHAAEPVGSIHGVDIVADLDLTNTDELCAATGATSERDLLADLYALDGADFVRRLRGGFAIALLDRRSKTLVLALDHVGIKRLYYVTNEQRTAFASRSAALRHVQGISGSVDPAGVYAYLNFAYVPAAVPIFQGVRRIPPGHMLVVTDGRAVLQEYWDIQYQENPVGTDDAAALYRCTREAISRSLRGRSLKNTGAFLSGGTDSSTVVGLMSHLTAERINTFSIGFGDERYDELQHAALTARHFNTSHYTHVITPEEALAHVPSLVAAYDEPFGNNSAIGTLCCARLARNAGMKWLLAGDGGDEMFGGNERYCTDRIFARYHHIPAVLRHRILEPILFRCPDGRSTVLGRAQRYVKRANLPNPRRFYSYEFFFAQHAAEWLAPDFLASVATDGPFTVLQKQYDRAHASSDLNRLLYLDLKLTIGDNDLFKVMRTAELADVGVRFPLLDVPLIEFTATLSADQKVRGMEKRYLFKRAFVDLLPATTLAKRKHGFGVPMSVWLRSHPPIRALARDTLLSPRATQRGFFRPGAMERLFELHDGEPTPYYGDLLWMILMLELWHREHVDAWAAPQ